jgi:hypothetical protein
MRFLLFFPSCHLQISFNFQLSIYVPGIDVDVEREHVLIPPNSEVLVKLIPELTIADPEIRSIPPVRHVTTRFEVILKCIHPHFVLSIECFI